MKKTRYRIVNKKRFTLSVLFIFSVIAFVIFLFINNVAFSSTYDDPYKEVLIKEGDTLWKIAREYTPNNYDIRKMVYEIREFNYMNSANIHPGDLIKVPIIYNY